MARPMEMIDSALTRPKPDTAADSPWRRAVADLLAGLRRYDLWGELAWNELRQRYRRSMIGPFWMTLSMAIMVAALGFLYSSIFRQPIQQYVPFIAAGLIIWAFLSALVAEGCTTFIASAHLIKQLPIPLSTHVFHHVWRSLIGLAHNVVIYVAVAFLYSVPVGTVTLLALPALALFVLNGMWASLLLGLLSARFRDVPLLVGSLLQVVFFFTPVLWPAELVPDRAIFIQLNPFHHFVEILRAPLLGEAPDAVSWWAVGLVTVAGWATALAFYARYRPRIAYWM